MLEAKSYLAAMKTSPMVVLLELAAGKRVNTVVGSEELPGPPDKPLQWLCSWSWLQVKGLALCWKRKDSLAAMKTSTMVAYRGLMVAWPGH